jgi:hypothetical protein
MNKNYSEIIDKMEKVRAKNNVGWMDILRLAFEYAPEESKKLVRKINKLDSEITKLWQDLAK